MRGAWLLSATFVLASVRAASAADTEGLGKLRQLAPAYARFTLSTRPLPVNVRCASLSVAGRVAAILRRVKGKAKDASWQVGEDSYVRSSVSEKDDRRIKEEISQRLVEQLKPDFTVASDCPVRILVRYEGYNVHSLVAVAGGPYRPDANFSRDLFVVDAERSELLSYQNASFSSDETSTTVDSLIRATAEDVRKVVTVLAEKPDVHSGPQKDQTLPRFEHVLAAGGNEVRIRNPNEFAVSVGIRSGQLGTDLEVGPQGVNSVRVPNGSYDVYFVYSNQPDALYQGDSFTLSSNGVEIEIVKVVAGNYGIRRVK